MRSNVTRNETRRDAATHRREACKFAACQEARRSAGSRFAFQRRPQIAFRRRTLSMQGAAERACAHPNEERPHTQETTPPNTEQAARTCP